MKKFKLSTISCNFCLLITLSIMLTSCDKNFNFFEQGTKKVEIHRYELFSNSDGTFLLDTALGNVWRFTADGSELTFSPIERGLNTRELLNEIDKVLKRPENAIRLKEQRLKENFKNKKNTVSD